METKQGETRFAPILVTPTSWRRTNIHMEFKHEKKRKRIARRHAVAHMHRTFTPMLCSSPRGILIHCACA